MIEEKVGIRAAMAILRPPADGARVCVAAFRAVRRLGDDAQVVQVFACGKESPKPSDP
jgi:hypothetical protein